MAANKKQGQSLALFLTGLTVTCGGILGFSSGIGKLALVVGLLILVVSFGIFLKIKPLEGKIATLGAQPAGMKLLGVLVVLLGWGVVLFGLHLTPSVGGRLIISLVGMAISLVGIVFILPAACNKNAIWKA